MRDPTKPAYPRLASASTIAVRAQKKAGHAIVCPHSFRPLPQLLLDLANESGLTGTGMSFAHYNQRIFQKPKDTRHSS